MTTMQPITVRRFINARGWRISQIGPYLASVASRPAGKRWDKAVAWYETFDPHTVETIAPLVQNEKAMMDAGTWAPD